ncbi:hypothetical protein [Asanoa iriomotensis]|nr:hypothetical protein [Asanoa iriomotensis]
MPEVIVGFELPETHAVAEATTRAQELTSPPVERVLGSPWRS